VVGGERPSAAGGQRTGNFVPLRLEAGRRKMDDEEPEVRDRMSDVGGRKRARGQRSDVRCRRAEDRRAEDEKGPEVRCRMSDVGGWRTGGLKTRGRKSEVPG